MYLELRTLDLLCPTTHVLHMDPAILLESRVKSGARLMLHRASPPSPIPAPLQDQPRYKDMAGCMCP
jgi:hypothetical protein